MSFCICLSAPLACSLELHVLKKLLGTEPCSFSGKQKWQAFSNLRTSSTIKPFDLASWVRKLLLLRPIFLSTRYSLTSSNFTSSRLGTLASAGLDLFLARGTIGVWNISFEASYSKYFCTSRNFCFSELFSCCVTLNFHPGKTPTLVMPHLFISQLEMCFFICLTVG